MVIDEDRLQKLIEILRRARPQADDTECTRLASILYGDTWKTEDELLHQLKELEEFSPGPATF